jgi:fluoride ion exporter CrcB/FEX
MGIGISILVGAVGAILRYAVTAPINQHGFNIHTGGVILMAVGAVGLLLSMLFWSSFAPFGRRAQSSSRREEVVTQDGHEQGRVVRERRDDVAN